MARRTAVLCTKGRIRAGALPSSDRGLPPRGRCHGEPVPPAPPCSEGGLPPRGHCHGEPVPPAPPCSEGGLPPRGRCHGEPVPPAPPCSGGGLPPLEAAVPGHPCHRHPPVPPGTPARSCRSSDRTSDPAGSRRRHADRSVRRP